MNHVWPYLRFYPHIDRPRYAGEPHRVIEHGFGRADVNRPSQIGIDPRRPWIGAVQVCGGKFRQIGLWINGPAAALELMLLPTASRSAQGELHPRLAGTVSVRWEEPPLLSPT